MATNTATKHAAICYFCPTVLVDRAPFNWVNGNHWTGTEYLRVDVCEDCHDAGRLARAPKRPRRRRVVNMATDWNLLVAFQARTTKAMPACAGAEDLCGAPAGQPCEPGCPSLASDEAEAR